MIQLIADDFEESSLNSSDVKKLLSGCVGAEVLAINKKVRWHSLLVLVPFIATIVFMFYNFIVRAPKARQAQAQLETEFSLLWPFPYAVAIHSAKSFKDAQALVVTISSTHAAYSTIHDYYDTEFPRNGWKFISERGLNDWGRDLGKRTSHYCKGDWSADFEYLGQNSDGTQGYAIALGWPANECK